jgi:uncharacterized RDD family membrane protein YckC
LERSVTVRTPEAIAFYYELAGLGSRFLALFIDSIIQGVLAFAVLLLFAAATPRAPAVASALHLSGKNFASLVLAILILLFFVIYYGYFVLFERYWNGQTPGKRLLGIRVVRDGGYPIELMDSIIRNLIRILEFALGFYFISVISMLASSENKRLGDFAAGTIVVRDRSMEVYDPKTWLTEAQPTSAATSVAGKVDSRELAVVNMYIARKTSLTPQAARQMAAKIAAMLRPKVGPELADLSDDELITRVAARQSR